MAKSIKKGPRGERAVCCASRRTGTYSLREISGKKRAPKSEKEERSGPVGKESTPQGAVKKGKIRIEETSRPTPSLRRLETSPHGAGYDSNWT